MRSLTFRSVEQPCLRMASNATVLELAVQDVCLEHPPVVTGRISEGLASIECSRRGWKDPADTSGWSMVCTFVAAERIPIGDVACVGVPIIDGGTRWVFARRIT